MQSYRARAIYRTVAACITILALVPAVEGVDTRDTRLLGQPVVSASHIAFIYAGDLWSARHDGSDVRRLTSHEGTESNPRFSPDGALIAFSAEYDGNMDVYVVPATGGEPRRLTWHPGADIARDFTVDGAAVLFSSPRRVHTNRHRKLYTVPVQGGYPVELPIPHAVKASYSPDGKHIAYTPIAERFRQWKNYRGGTVTRIWLYDTNDHSVEQIPQPEGRSNDTDPMWMGDTVYFLSDRNGEFNLFSYDLDSRRVEQLTHHDDFPVLSASKGAGRIIYEKGGYLHLFAPEGRRSDRLVVGVAADLIETRARYEAGAEFIRNHSISPSGARAAFEFRGDILTLPAEKGDARNLTQTTGSHERSPAWSPDGKSVAYFSDASGEYALHVAPQNGRGEPRRYELDGNGFYHNPRWSPDSKKVSYWDNSLTLYWVDLESGAVEKVDSEYRYSPIRFFHHRWAPDSKWITYTLDTKAYVQKVYVYSLEERKSYEITDGLSEASAPVFDRSGKYLYFFASTDAGPVKHWSAMSNADVAMTQGLYVAVLGKDTPSPLAKQSDEETGVSDDEESEASDEASAGDVTIDFERLHERILTIPVMSSLMSNLQVGSEGELYYLRDAAFGRTGDSTQVSLHRYKLSDREEETLTSGVADYQLTPSGKKLLYRSEDAWAIVSSEAKIEPGSGKLPIEALEVRVEPRAEWAQIFREAWRINRDYFYDPNMHGADWQATGEKYEIFLEHLANRDDLNRVIQWMCSELAVGHHRVAGGDTRAETEPIAGGLLGADYVADNGRYRVQKIYGGLNWNPELRSPLTEPGVGVVVGDYLLDVDGRALHASENLYERFEKTAEKIVRITVGPSPDGAGSRSVDVVPIANEQSLRNRDWVEGNIRKVARATNGRVAYVYVPNTASMGHTYFKRYFFPQTDKEAIIVDERYNGGGQVADYYIDLLRRPFISYWATRYGADIVTPSAAILGPKVMIIDETAGSGGDLLPWMFRKLGIGKLVGKRTWGGLVGTLGFPILMDGGFVTAPDLAIWNDDGWVVENVGVPPDIEVEQLPAEVIAGRDPQLEKAIEVVLSELEKNPQPSSARPSYPVRVRRDER